MDIMTGLNAALDYIEEHLEDGLDLKVAAMKAGTSEFHFQRAFGFITGIGLSEYVRNRRMTQAAFELTSTNQRIIDVALKYGYDSHEAFTRAFQKVHGVVPSKARTAGASLKAYPRLTFTVSIKGVSEMNYRIEKKPAFHFFGIERVVSMANGENNVMIPQFWQELLSNGTVDAIADAAGGPAADAPKERMLVHAIMCYREMADQQFPYMIGAFESNQSQTQGYDRIEVPEQDWAVFTTEDYGQESVTPVIQSLWQRIFAEWFPTSGYTHADGPELEVYCGRESGMEFCEIWIPVVKA